jgi:hypothetical protein
MILTLIAAAWLWPVPADGGEPLAVRVTSFPGIAAEGLVVDCLTIKSGLTLTGPPQFGGLSSLQVEGDRALMVSDAGGLVEARLSFDADGAVSGFEGARYWPLTRKNGEALGKSRGDAEGLVLHDDRLFVSLEGLHRIATFAFDGDAIRQAGVLHRDDRPALRRNSGYEALTALPDGRLLAIAEGTDKEGHAPVLFLRESGDGWTVEEAGYASPAPFQVTEARIDSLSGDLIVLERAFSRLTGPRARLARVPAADIAPGAVMRGRTIATLGFLHGIDNMEGLALSRNGEGRLLAHLLSDDNFSSLQRTVLISGEIREDGCSVPAAEPGPRTDTSSQ